MGKNEEYKLYVKEHQNNVKLVWRYIQPDMVDEYWLDDFSWFHISQLVETHDNSKYSDGEFEGYRQYFYPEDNAEKSKPAFNRAWLSHIHDNPHHWQHWVIPTIDGGRAVDMPFFYVFEMLCDWSAMSVKFDGSPSIWYRENCGKIVLHNTTERTIVEWLPIFDRAVERIISHQYKKAPTG